MSKKETPKPSKTTAPKKPSALLVFLRSERCKFIIGLLILLAAAIYAFGYVSFLCGTGKGDQSILEHLSGWDLVRPGNGVENWGGALGALMAEMTINRWLGAPVILLDFLLFRLGTRMMRAVPIASLGSIAVRHTLLAVWLSALLGFLSTSICPLLGDGFSYWIYALGGMHGYQISQFMYANLGWWGTFLLLAGLGVILAVFFFPSTIDKVRSSLSVWTSLQAYREKRSKLNADAKETVADDPKRENEESVDTGTADEPVVPVSDPVVPVSGPVAPHVKAPVEEPADGPVVGPIAHPVDTPIEDPDEEEGTVVRPQPVVSPVNPVDEGEDDVKDPGTDVKRPGTDVKDPNFTIKVPGIDVVEEPIIPKEDYDPTKDLEFYEFPGFDLLKSYDNNVPVDKEEQNANMEKIKNTLASYGVEIQSITATVGPTITLFEIVPVNGTRIARVRNLSDEIAMSIASTAGIRIIAPIPGKSAIGIEVPNRDPQTVSMRECITSRAFQESKMELPVALGKTITNEVFTFDLAKAPHLLVAGATGQGKSVGLNAIITSLLYRKHPSQLKIVLVDPKMVEFSIYKRIEKHYLARLADEEDPIITDVSKVVATLQSVCAEMEDRYALVREAGVRNIKEYNEKFIKRELNPKIHVQAPIGSREGTHHHYMPYLVVVVDEYGDLIMTAGKEVELPIARIAQKARAVGIHMIIATQRPSAKIVTGLIKANFPARIAFRVSSSIDSSIILDQPGAQNLIGRGDLLFSTGNVPTRVQCAFVDTPEVDRINRFIADQQSYPTAHILPEPRPQEGEGGDGEGGSSGPVDLNNLDPLFNDAAELVVATGQGSTSMIQRKCGIGYARAGRIMDQLEAAGIVGPYTGSKARAVLIDSDMELRNILDGLKQG